MSRVKIKLSPFFKQCLVTAAVGITNLSQGSLFGVPSVLLTQMHHLNGVEVTKEDISWLASVPSISTLVGGFLIPPIMGKLGRKLAHLVVIVLILVSWVILALGNDLTVLLIGRILQGLSFGMMLPLRSVLIGEYTSPKNRGAFLTTISLTQGGGVLFIHLVGTFCHWRTSCYICAAIAVVSLVITVFSPETPSWLAEKQKYSECKKSFHWLRGYGEDDELEKMIKARTDQHSEHKISSLKDLKNVLSEKEFYLPIVLIFHGYMMGELSGPSILAAYPSMVITAVTGPNIDVNFWIISLGILRITSNFVGIFITRKLRRRVIIITSGTVSILCYLVLGGYKYLRDQKILVYEPIWLPLFFLSIMYITMVFVIGMPYIIAGEIFPIKYRSIGGSVSILGITIAGFSTIKTFPGLIQSIGFEGTCVMYAAFLTYGLIVVSCYLPETKGKTLLEIEEELRGIPKDKSMRLENNEGGEVQSGEEMLPLTALKEDGDVRKSLE